MKCGEVRETLPALVGGGEQSLAVRRHLSRCSECRAELRSYEGLLEDLGSLRAAHARPPADLLASLVAIPTRQTRLDAARIHVFRNRRAYVGSAVAIAGLAGAAVWRRRRMAVA